MSWEVLQPQYRLTRRLPTNSPNRRALPHALNKPHLSILAPHHQPGHRLPPHGSLRLHPFHKATYVYPTNKQAAVQLEPLMPALPRAHCPSMRRPLLTHPLATG